MTEASPTGWVPSPSPDPALPDPAPRVHWSSRAVLLAAIGLATAVALLLDRPPAPAADSAPAGEFSAMRALAHLRVIARAPRPVGSDAHASARAYILETLRSHGLEPAVQAARSRAVTGGQVQNIVAVLSGREPGRGPALLLVSHYDSVAAGPGASDDGAAVAAMLETLRALRAGPLLANDIVFLFTDAEEVGLVGAAVFAEEHPLAGRIGAALNFEARGSGGQVFMFETSPDNGWLIDQLAASTPHIAASSLSVEVYRRMPNDTDFTVFRRRGTSGMNFAYIGGLHDYHTAGDSIENLDLGSLQHHGGTMLALARRLGDADLGRTRSRDAVYFNLAGAVFVHYSSSWVLPLLAVAGAVFLGAVGFGVRRRTIRWRRALAGLGVLLAMMAATALLVSLATRAAIALDPGLTRAAGAPHDAGPAMIGLASLAAAIALLVLAGAARRASPAELAAGALTGWLVLAALTAIALPGASFLFTWPLLCGGVGLWSLVLARPGRIGPRQTAVLAMVAIPCITILAPIIRGVYVAMSIAASGGILVLVALTAGVLAAPLAAAFGPGRGRA